MITTKWNNHSRTWYESKGYIGYKKDAILIVPIEDLSHGSGAKVKVICDYCGSEYEVKYSAYMKRRETLPKDACCNCNGLKSKEATLRKRADKKYNQLLESCEKFGYKLLTTKEEYTDCKMIIKYVCPKHGVQEVIMDNIIRGHKCIKCSYEDRFDMIKLSTDFVKSSIESINNNILLNPEEYKNYMTANLKIRCSCGNIFTVSYGNYIRAGINRCSKCSHSESSGEKCIREILDKYAINYETQKRFHDCKNIRPLPFDFYLPEYNLVIEYDGEGHYLEHFYNNKSDSPKEALLETQRKDSIKTDYCNNNNIDLLRIPYWEKENILDIIDAKLTECKIA